METEPGETSCLHLQTPSTGFTSLLLPRLHHTFFWETLMGKGTKTPEMNRKPPVPVCRYHHGHVGPHVL
ncbi:unnamed protein product [Pleuronectes platessa]|uniref:Uncharacterized protein n=1 Tax=Pleuronectes platessa TaxID=8262 RepID=A0A9N7VBX6_PLEPL|nr:unnamed protein product [Pleuronectes platessa]